MGDLGSGDNYSKPLDNIIKKKKLETPQPETLYTESRVRLYIPYSTPSAVKSESKNCHALNRSP